MHSSSSAFAAAAAALLSTLLQQPMFSGAVRSFKSGQCNCSTATSEVRNKGVLPKSLKMGACSSRYAEACPVVACGMHVTCTCVLGVAC
jgi:hypothetical protein